MTFKDQVMYLKDILDFAAEYSMNSRETQLKAEGMVYRAWVKSEIGMEDMLALKALLRTYKKKGWILK